MRHAQMTNLVADVEELTGPAFEPSIPPPMHAVPPCARLKTFADVDDFIRQHPDWAKCRDSLRSTCRGFR